MRARSDAAGRRRTFPEPLAKLLARGTRVRCCGRAKPGQRACDARKTLNMPLQQYARVPSCPVCGRRAWRVDVARSLERGRYSPKPCTCGEYPFPHRRGSRWCSHNRGNWPAEERDYGATGWTPSK